MEEMNLPYIPFVDQYNNSDGEGVTEEMIAGMYTAMKAEREPLLEVSEHTKAHLQENGVSVGVYAVTGQQTGQPGQKLTSILSHQEIIDHIGKDMIQTVGAVEIPIQEALAQDFDETKAAIKSCML
jgi:hypothetical protein